MASVVCILVCVRVCVCVGVGCESTIQRVSYCPAIFATQMYLFVCAKFSSVGSSEFGIKKRAGNGGAHNHPQ
jgi:hypothetical protein